MESNDNKIVSITEKLQKSVISEDQLENVYKELDDVVESSDELKMVANMPSNNGVLENHDNVNNEIESEQVMMKRNVMTGKEIPLGPASDFAASKEKLNLDTCLNNLPYSIYDVSISDEDISSISEEFNVNVEDTNKIIHLAKRYQAKEKMNLFAELPATVQASIMKELVDIGNVSANAKKLFAETFITNIISGIAIDQYQVEFDKMIAEAFNEDIPELTDTLISNIRTRKSFLYEKAVELDEKGEAEKASTIREIADACEEAYTYTKFKEAIKNHSFKIKKIELEQFNKVFRDFDLKYQNSVYKITTVSALPTILNRVLKVDNGISTSDIVKFAVAFCKYTSNMHPSNPVEHSYMYYFIDTIIALDMAPAEPENKEFANSVISNIEECISLLKEYYK